MSDLTARRDADAAARAAAQQVFDRPLLLTAGAGTGKTSTLVARVVVWCLGPGWERAVAGSDTNADPGDISRRVLRGVVAITFTEYAAAEMAERIGLALARMESGGTPEGLLEQSLRVDPDTLRHRARALIESLDQLSVRTIHAYCQRLLSRFPLEAGLHPAFEVDAEQTASAEVIREQLERQLRGPWADARDPIWRGLVRAGIGPQDLERALRGVLDAGLPADAFDIDPFAAERVEQFRRELQQCISDFSEFDAGRMAAAKRAKRGVAIETALRASANALAGLAGSASELEACCATLREAWGQSELKGLADWRKGKFGLGEAEILGDRAEAFRPIAARLERALRAALQLQPMRLQTLRRALAPLLRSVSGELRARGACSYDDLLRSTLELLTRNAGVRARIRSEIDQLLVDEFQDTDHTQCEILRCLALGGDESTRPGLFLVGDPKQSIYGWRSADLAAYEAFVRDVAAAGGESWELTVNYRSVPEILAEVERVMRPGMRYEADVQPEFSALIPSERASTGPDLDAKHGSPVEYWVSWSRRRSGEELGAGRNADAVRVEARALAEDLVQLREAGQSLGSVALLFRSRTQIDSYLSALREAGVLYRVESDRGFAERREIIEAAALVRCILDPRDALALLVWLRSASVGVPDAALLPLWQHQLPGFANDLRPERIREFVREASADVPESAPGLERIRGWEQNLVAALEAIAALRSSYHGDPPDVFVEKLRARTAVEATESARPLGAHRVANLDQFFRRLAERLASGEQDAHQVLRSLRGDLQQLREEPAGGSLADSDAVAVMTIHQAKGLDFDHVYLLQAQREAGGDRADETVCAELGGVWEYRLLGMPTLAFQPVLARRERVARAEQVRTLYVALTRAKHRLVIAGSWPAQGREAAASSHLRVIAGREGGVPDLHASAASLDRRIPTADAARWSFVANELSQAAPEALDIRASAGRAARARADAEQLESLLEQSAQRMRRPFRAAASQGTVTDIDAAESIDAPARHARANGSALESEVAARVGTEIHRVLEEIDLRADAETEFQRQRERLARRLVGAPAARANALELLDELRHGELLARLRNLEPHIAARELPVLLPPSGAAGPVAYVEGVADLVYRDPNSGEWVIADYKTNALEEDGPDLYRSQGATYAEAIRGAMDLSETPRFELWFLRSGRIVNVDLDALHSRAP